MTDIAPDSMDLEIKELLAAIFQKYNHDFRDYSEASVKRRVTQALLRFELASVGDLQRLIERDSSAFYELLQFLTIPTSEMFRDPAYFLGIRKEIVPYLKTFSSAKIWVAGCSTGEEVYSLAILLREEGVLERTIIYATDINPRSLEKAEAGLFNADEVKKFTQNYQSSGGKSTFSDYYTAAYGSAIFDASLRKHITFADHSLATDNVFSEVHFVSCRNVLIYFNRDLQNRAFGLFHDSLYRRGYLGLGSKESLRFSDYAQYFQLVLKDEKIYQKES